MSPTPGRPCPKCGGEVRDGWRVCPACAVPLDAETRTIFHESSSSSLEEGRFPAGTVLAGRYRILGLLGQGGMGEVYRAYDLILNQAVALKFLPQAQMSEPALARFRNEVRIARQVSHPNVCRVYDIGFVEGLHFISMEYLDGEDLGSLLRRIGRLPQDKAIEFTRKICAGLSAAHERGVLHRDLKPSNIMIDGRGHVRITDFGLAALAQEIALGDIRSGTPAYMSPEQKAGKEVTIRSDIYSLGLVLHEMFTGKKRGDSQSSPSEIVKDLDPAVERVMLRCLEEDPRRRPQSALNVAMALPGADPIAAALAAGETPSPEMVAASQEKEGFSPRTAGICFAVTLVLLALGTFLAAKTTLLSKIRLDVPPDVMAFRAQELLKQLGYTETPAVVRFGFDLPNRPLVAGFFQNDRAIWERVLTTGQPPLIRFWYRQYHDKFFVDSFFTEVNGEVTYDSPANTEPGMARLSLDPLGRLIALEIHPREANSGETVAPSKPDWSILLRSTGLDLSRFQPAAPRKIPPVAADTRAAWAGTFDVGRLQQVRVEAAAWEGRPVYLWIGSGNEPPPNQNPAWVIVMVIVVALASVGGAVVLGWYNLRAGRADRAGAATVAWVTLGAFMAWWALHAEHVATTWEIRLVLAAIGEGGLWAAVAYLSYVAIEPYARRHWPDSLISWKRVLAGRFRDPLVASHVLAGVVAMVACERFLLRAAALALSAPPEIPWPAALNDLESSAYPLLRISLSAINSMSIVLAFLVTVVLLRLLLRRMWIADCITALLFGAFPLPVFAGGRLLLALWVVQALLRSALVLWLLRRFGLLAAAVAWLVFYIDHSVYVPGAWYAGRSLVLISIPGAMAAWALWVILSAQRGPSTESDPA